MPIRNMAVYPGQLVQRFLGSAYDNVKIVADNIDDVILVANNIVAITNTGANLANIGIVANDIASVNSAATNMAAIIAAPTEASNAADSADAALVSEGLADADAIATDADRVQTGLDAIATAADRVQTGLDRTAVAVDLVLTDADQQSCEADRILAQAAAVTAQSALDNSIYQDVEELIGPTTKVMDETDRGKLFTCNTAGGQVDITLPLIDTMVIGGYMPFTFGAKKISNDGNNVVITRSGADTIDNAETSKTISSINASLTVVADDLSGTPDAWASIPTGASTGNVVIQEFVDVTDYTAGTTTQLTLSQDPGGENNVRVYFDGIYQFHSEFTVAGTTLDFGGGNPIPLGVEKVEVVMGVTVPIGTPGDNTISTVKLQNGSVTKAKIETAMQLPAGMVAPFAMATPPTGWLQCDGASVSRTTYADLFAAIGVIYGNVDGNTFNLPDYQGEFLRGWDNGAGIDPDAASRTNRGDGTTGDVVGSKQADEFKSHTHDFNTRQTTGGGYPTGGGGNDDGDLPTTATGGNETRPRNVNVLYCIKA